MNTAVRTQNVPFLPPAWAAMLKRSALFGAGAGWRWICAAALASRWSAIRRPIRRSIPPPADDAAECARTSPARLFADAALQTAGLGGRVVLLLVIGAWGLRLMRGEIVGWLWLRTVGAVAAALLIAMGLEVIPAPGVWPIAAGLGGSAGQVLLDLCDAPRSADGALDPLVGDDSARIRRDRCGVAGIFAADVGHDG